MFRTLSLSCLLEYSHIIPHLYRCQQEKLKKIRAIRVSAILGQLFGLANLANPPGVRIDSPGNVGIGTTRRPGTRTRTINRVIIPGDPEPDQKARFV